MIKIEIIFKDKLTCMPTTAKAIIEKPKVFIASSSKALPYATAVKGHISDVCNVYVWRDVPNYPYKTITDWILNLAEKYDFGIFIFSNDDKIALNKKQYPVVRDNVLFELGLFSGRLGFDRCTVLKPNIENFHLPSDINGILETKFDQPDAEEDITSELRVPCEKIKLDIKRRWADIVEQRKTEAKPERIAAICYRKSKESGLYEFLLVKSSDKKRSRRGFPKKPFDKNDTRNPVDVAIEVAAEEGGVKVRKTKKAEAFEPFSYKKESEGNSWVKYTPFLLEVVGNAPLSAANKNRLPDFFTLGDVFKELRNNRNDLQTINSLERVICKCYEFLLRE
jgi:predicted nucleotide-binding protein